MAVLEPDGESSLSYSSPPRFSCSLVLIQRMIATPNQVDPDSSLKNHAEAFAAAASMDVHGSESIEMGAAFAKYSRGQRSYCVGQFLWGMAVKPYRLKWSLVCYLRV